MVCLLRNKYQEWYSRIFSSKWAMHIQYIWPASPIGHQVHGSVVLVSHTAAPASCTSPRVNGKSKSQILHFFVSGSDHFCGLICDKGPLFRLEKQGSGWFLYCERESASLFVIECNPLPSAGQASSAQI